MCPLLYIVSSYYVYIWFVCIMWLCFWVMWLCIGLCDCVLGYVTVFWVMWLCLRLCDYVFGLCKILCFGLCMCWVIWLFSTLCFGLCDYVLGCVIMCSIIFWVKWLCIALCVRLCHYVLGYAIECFFLGLSNEFLECLFTVICHALSAHVCVCVIVINARHSAESGLRMCRNALLRLSFLTMLLMLDSVKPVVLLTLWKSQMAVCCLIWSWSFSFHSTPALQAS